MFTKATRLLEITVIFNKSNTFGLYDYIINGTEKAVSEIVKDL